MINIIARPRQTGKSKELYDLWLNQYYEIVEKHGIIMALELDMFSLFIFPTKRMSETLYHQALIDTEIPADYLNKIFVSINEFDITNSASRDVYIENLDLIMYANSCGFDIKDIKIESREKYIYSFLNKYFDTMLWNFTVVFDSNDTPTKLTQTEIDNFIKDVTVFKFGTKTTIVAATLQNDFVIVEQSSCVNPSDYNEEIGREICMKAVKDKVWELLGFYNQQINSGVSIWK